VSTARGLTAEAERTGNLLGAAALAISGAIDASLSADHVRSEAANAALAIMLQWPPRSIGHLARVLRRSHSATVRLIEELEGEELVAKQPGSDRRAVVATLTAEGRRQARRVIAARAGVLNGLMERLTAEDRREFTRLLERILPLLTPDRETSDHICRLCQLAACPQDRCPVELAVPSAGGI